MGSLTLKKLIFCPSGPSETQRKAEEDKPCSLRTNLRQTGVPLVQPMMAAGAEGGGAAGSAPRDGHRNRTFAFGTLRYSILPIPIPPTRTTRRDDGGCCRRAVRRGCGTDCLGYGRDVGELRAGDKITPTLGTSCVLRVDLGSAGEDSRTSHLQGRTAGAGLSSSLLLERDDSSRPGP